MADEGKQGMPVQQMSINHRTLPVFTDRSITATQVASKPGKNKKKAERKEGTIRVIFMDSVSNASVADVVMTAIAAEQLMEGIRQSLERLKAEVEDPGMPSAAPQPEQSQHAYIG